MKYVETILVTQLDIQKKQFGKNISLVNNYILFEIMVAKHCSGCDVADVKLLEVKGKHFEMVLKAK